MKSKSKIFDQFYTKKSVAEECFQTVLELYGSDVFFVEPSAGTGSFIFDGYSYYACDIDPKFENIHKKDFIRDNIIDELPKDKTIITVGNPPFGHRAKLAVDFVNKALTFSKAVCFILPVQFEKYNTQILVNESAYLVYDKELKADSFIHDDESYSVRCCFQIWENNSDKKDLRKRVKPSIEHPDFILYQYNNTKEALKYFDKDKYNWDFAVVRQGFNDYTIRETNPDNMPKNKQWLFVKANNDKAYEILYNMDFEKLSKKNTSTPGFGKADVVEEYEKLTNKTFKIENFF